MRNPDFVICGAQKAASTSLSDNLSGVDGVSIPYAEIPWLESPYYESGGPERIRYLLGSYDSNDLVGIKRPNYLGTSGMADRLVQHFPNVRVVIVLRNPTDRAVSACRHYMEYGHIPLMPVSQAIAMLMKNSYLGPRAHEILMWGKYEFLIEPYRRILPRNLVVIGPQAIADGSAAGLVMSACGVQGGERGMGNGSHSNVGSDSWVRLRWRRAALNLAARKDPRTGQLIVPPRRTASATVGSTLLAAERRWPRGRRGSASRLTLTPELRGRLDQYYARDIAYVAENWSIHL
jgi:hypothetical protein